MLLTHFVNEYVHVHVFQYYNTKYNSIAFATLPDIAWGLALELSIKNLTLFTFFKEILS